MKKSVKKKESESQVSRGSAWEARPAVASAAEWYPERDGDVGDNLGFRIVHDRGNTVVRGKGWLCGPLNAQKPGGNRLSLESADGSLSFRLVREDT